MQCLVCQRHAETKKLSTFLNKYVQKSQGKSEELKTVRCSSYGKHACESAYDVTIWNVRLNPYRNEFPSQRSGTHEMCG